MSHSPTVKMEDVDIDVAADAEMRDMMGFASFGMQKPEPSRTSSSTSLPRKSVGKKAKFGDNDPNLPAKPVFIRPISKPTTKSFADKPESTASTLTNRSNNYSEVVYTNPVTGISFTRQQLYEYGQGQKANEKGDVIFFRPSFLDEDPWKALRAKK